MPNWFGCIAVTPIYCLFEPHTCAGWPLNFCLYGCINIQSVPIIHPYRIWLYLYMGMVLSPSPKDSYVMDWPTPPKWHAVQILSHNIDFYLFTMFTIWYPPSSPKVLGQCLQHTSMDQKKEKIMIRNEVKKNVKIVTNINIKCACHVCKSF